MSKRPAPSILIVADDLTGSLDSAVAFAGPGRRVLAARRIEAVAEALERRPDVLAVNTGSRELSEGAAQKRIEVLAGALDLSAVGLVVKKVDSRLKGHVAAETSALRAALGGRPVLAAPAIPGMGRVVRDGWLTGGGIAGRIDVAGRFGAARGWWTPGRTPIWTGRWPRPRGRCSGPGRAG